MMRGLIYDDGGALAIARHSIAWRGLRSARGTMGERVDAAEAAV